MQQQLKITKDNNEKIKIKNEISKIREQKMTRKINQSIKERKLEIKHNESESVSKGKQPFYLKRKEIKKIEQEERIKEVQKEGKYGKYMKRKSEKEFKKNRVNSKNWIYLLFVIVLYMGLKKWEVVFEYGLSLIPVTFCVNFGNLSFCQQQSISLIIG